MWRFVEETGLFKTFGLCFNFFVQAEDGIREAQESRGLGDFYKRQAQRNASQAVNAIVSADLALADTVCPVPADEAIEAMYRVGKQLPRELRETALGGIAESETGKRIADEIRNQ